MVVVKKVDGFFDDLNLWYFYLIGIIGNFCGLSGIGIILEEVRVCVFLWMFWVGEGIEGLEGYEGLYGG